MRVFYFSLLLSYVLYLPGQTVSGTVIDANTKEAIGYATVSNEDNSQGTYTSETGTFSITGSIGDTLTVGSLGYQTQVFIISSANSFQVHLVPVSYALKTVDVAKRRKSKAKKKMVGKVKKSNRFGLSSDKGMILSRYMPNEEKATGYLAALAYRFLNTFTESCAGLIRVRIFEAVMQEGTLKPGKDLLLDSPITALGPKRTIYKVDATKWAIEIPEAGLFVGMEFLGEQPDCPSFNPGRHGKSISFSTNSKEAHTWLRTFNGDWQLYRSKLGEGNNINLMVAAEFRLFKD
ncbi:MAG: carboxypeptidase-like regulatory domain-containing protein [Bacteroidota bacterium]